MKLIHADCLEVMKEMPDNSVDCVVTDPPYGIGEAAGKNKTRGERVPATDYGVLDWDNAPPNQDYFDELIRVSKNQVIFGGNFFDLPPSPCWIVWDKDNGACDFADCELAWTSFKTAVRLFKYKWHGMLQGNMAHKEKRVHPTQKPLPVMEWIIRNFTQEGETILDPFMGSGTTGVACAKLGREFMGIELHEPYYEIAKKRISEWQGQQRLEASR